MATAGKGDAPPPLFVVISGPSGVGKDAVMARLKASHPEAHFVVTATTRPARPGEKDEEDYHFLSAERFEGMQAEGGFLESAVVYGHRYGVPRREVAAALGQGQDVLVRTDVQGAATLRALAPEAVLIFLTPGSAKELEARLRRRQSESPEERNRRLAAAKQEAESLALFDYLVPNPEGALDGAVQTIEGILTTEKHRVRPRRVRLQAGQESD